MNKQEQAAFIFDDAQSIVQNVDMHEVRGKSILLTGATGLIGHYFVAALTQAAYAGDAPSAVYLISRYAAHDYYAALCSGLSVTIMQGDVTDEVFLRSLPSADLVVHAAGYGQPGKFMQDEIKTLQINTFVTLSLFKKLKPGGKFLFLSSSELYSGLSNPPYTEEQIGTTMPSYPRACYIEGKRCGEAIVNAYRRQGVNAKSARLCLAYGPGVKKGDVRVLNSFIQRGIEQGRVECMDAGKAMRTYLYVTDAVQMLFKILFWGREEVYNVGGTSRVSIADLARLVATIIGVPVIFPEVSHVAIPEAPSDVFLNIQKIRKEFGVDSLIPLETGIRNTVRWYQMLYDTV